MVLPKLLVEGGPEYAPMLCLPQSKQPVIDPDLPAGLGFKQCRSHRRVCINLTGKPPKSEMLWRNPLIQ